MFKTLSILTSLILAMAVGVSPQAETGGAGAAWRAVSGTGTHFFNTAIVHSAEDTSGGKIQRSTETVELTGDLVGRVLFQPTSEIDAVKGTLVNTGRQVFSGSVLGSRPVLLYDDEFHFEVDLNTGATTGEIYLLEQIAGPEIRCRISMAGTREMSEGNSTFTYQGKCRTETQSL